MGLVLGCILPYLVFSWFLAATIYRIRLWTKVGVPFKLTMFPSPRTMFGVVGDLIQEVFGFRSLWRGNKLFWLIAWGFHAALAFVLIGHLIGISFTGYQFTVLGVGQAQSIRLSQLFGTYAGLILLAALCSLTLRRLKPVLRRISSLADYGILILLLGISGSGMYMRIWADLPYSEVHTFMHGLITLHPVSPPVNPAFLIHFALVQVLLLYFPFCKLLHACGLFFSRWLITRPYERQVILK